MRRPHLFAALALIVGAVPARAQTSIGFEEFAAPTNQAQLNGLVTQGFQFSLHLESGGTSFGCHFLGCFETTGSTWSEFAGSTGLYAGLRGWTTTMTQVDGDPFSIRSIDVAQSSGGGGGPPCLISKAITFVGHYAAGDSTSQTFGYCTNGHGLPTYTNEVFNNTFTGLADLSWDDQFNQVDNIVVTSATPEPASLTLVATGLIGIAFARPRRRNRQDRDT